MYITEDMHFHSTYSDGANTVESNIAWAVEQGLRRVCCVDHVRSTTTWVPDFVRTVDTLRRERGDQIEIFAGIEAKLLGETGLLDVPSDLDAHIDFIYAADHRFPLGKTALLPAEVIKLLQQDVLTKEHAFEALTNAMVGAMERYNHVVVAHAFSILPKVGLDEDHIPEKLIARLGKTAFNTGSTFEISERWRCPRRRTVDILIREGAQIVFSTDAHQRSDIGRYDYCLQFDAIPTRSSTQ